MYEQILNLLLSLKSWASVEKFKWPAIGFPKLVTLAAGSLNLRVTLNSIFWLKVDFFAEKKEILHN